MSYGSTPNPASRLGKTAKRQGNEWLSKIRLSISFRLSLQYVRLLLSSLLSYALAFSVVFVLLVCILKGAQVQTVLDSFDPTVVPVLPSPEMGLTITEYGQPLYHVGQAETADGWFVFDWDTQTPTVAYTETQHINGSAYTFRFLFQLRDEWFLYRHLLLALFVLEVLRMIKIVQKGKEKNRNVLSPIDDIAQAAQSLSASDLSLRINVAGTKNELKDLAVVINDMLDRIEGAYNSQKQFVSDASHELRTPIAVIQGYAAMLERWGKEDRAVLDESVAAIYSEADNMKDLVEKLLFLARHDKNTFRLEKELVHIKDIAQDLLKDAQLLTKEHIVTAGCFTDAVVSCDKNAIKQALRIFVENAIKYTPAEGTIIIDCGLEDGAAYLSVADTGMGMTKEEAHLAFQRFYRSDAVRNEKIAGHGLGLSIARLIVTSHGGKISVKTSPGQGSRFRIWLPMQPV